MPQALVAAPLLSGAGFSLRGTLVPQMRAWRTELRRRLKPAPLALLLFAATLHASPVFYTILGDEPGAWPAIFESIGLRSGVPPRIVVIRAGMQPPSTDWQRRIEQGTVLVLEGESETAAAFGFRAGTEKVAVRAVVEARSPGTEIIWEKPMQLPRTAVPAAARIFARERWTGAPLLAGFRSGEGGVLWLAATPGERGYERFPYLLHALADLGVDPGLRARRLWAFFDSSYRLRVDLDYIADRWRRSGISALHVAAWHYNEPDADRDGWLRRLIDACHRRAIQVYAWLELPHVSERFWQEHPEWREKTATGQDAHLDWRKLMNLQNPECRSAALAATRSLIERFDWDGVNLGELYFESLEGASNPARFTPFNDDVRRAFRERYGVEPVPADPRFLELRSGLARDMQEFWIGAVDDLRRAGKRDLDLVLTHVDDRFDGRMRDLIGADAEQVLPLLDRRDFTFLIEDPATVWHLGPERYTEIAARYRTLTRSSSRLGIDLNIVERYQDVYPTRKQTGTELFQLVQTASRAFRRVALYFENSLAPEDLPLLPAAAAVIDRYEQSGDRVVVDSPTGVGVAWSGGALVNGRPWPVIGDGTLWLPAGAHVLERDENEPPIRVLEFNGELKSAQVTGAAIELSYESGARAMAILSAAPSAIEIDGQRAEPALLPGNVLLLPRGQHILTLYP